MFSIVTYLASPRKPLFLVRLARTVTWNILQSSIHGHHLVFFKTPLTTFMQTQLVNLVPRPSAWELSLGTSSSVKKKLRPSQQIASRTLCVPMLFCVRVFLAQSTFIMKSRLNYRIPHTWNLSTKQWLRRYAVHSIQYLLLLKTPNEA